MLTLLRVALLGLCAQAAEPPHPHTLTLSAGAAVTMDPSHAITTPLSLRQSLSWIPAGSRNTVDIVTTQALGAPPQEGLTHILGLEAALVQVWGRHLQLGPRLGNGARVHIYDGDQRGISAGYYLLMGARVQTGGPRWLTTLDAGLEYAFTASEARLHPLPFLALTAGVRL